MANWADWHFWPAYALAVTGGVLLLLWSVYEGPARARWLRCALGGHRLQVPAAGWMQRRHRTADGRLVYESMPVRGQRCRCGQRTAWDSELEIKGVQPRAAEKELHRAQ